MSMIGVKIQFSSDISIKQRKILSEYILREGGAIASPRPSKMFSSSDLNNDITHIISQTSDINRQALVNRLNCNGISNNIMVVSAEWLSDCKINQKRVDELNYLVNIDKNDSNNNISTCLVELNNTSSTKRQRTEEIIIDKDVYLLDDLNLTEIRTNEWIQNNQLIYRFDENLSKKKFDKIVCFDLDGTIIITKSGKRFATNEDDWKLFDNRIVDRINNLDNSNTYVAIISNQGGIKKNKQSFNELTTKIDKILKLFSASIDVICSIDDDIYRKPRTGMWEYLIRFRGLEHINSAIYVGDAAGRPKDGMRSKDFSDSDLKFAINCGIKFMTPEGYFMGSTNRLHCDIQLPVDLPLDRQPMHLLSEEIFIPIDSNIYDIVVLVAPPASGKTSLSRLYVDKGYHRVCRDELKSIDRCIESVRLHANSLDDKTVNRRGAVIDNTNTSISHREQWIHLARELNANVRCIRVKTTKDVCFALSKFRLLDRNTATADRRVIDKIVIYKFFKDLQEPSLSEGFDKVHIVEWSPNIPLDIKSRKLFSQYLL